jgi:valyl-tRNA synthetase
MKEKKTLSKVYNPQEVEKKWYDFWIDQQIFRADEAGEGTSYSIVIPPPNVTGSLHMGHALNNTLQDILIRMKRMQGFNALWVPGMDHAGIATQNVVERQLAEEGKSRHDLGREKFIERVWKWREESGGTIIHQLKRLGASCDWSRERFTMDEGLSRAVKEVFYRLYHEGLIYRGDYVINWCPRCHTALSDLEVEHEPLQGYLYHIRYPMKDGGETIVATTRPETMLGDTAVAVNPSDERYKSLIGKQAVLPLINREIPVIADRYVDVDFGTGALKVTPAHDPNDFMLGQTHHLENIRVIDDDGIMNEAAGTVYQGLDRFACREKIVEDLEAQGYLIKIEPYEHQVGHCYRCKTVIEPSLSKQWFVKIKPLAQKAMAAVREGQTRIIPEAWEKTYFDWMENIRDWCISRQIWWGHRIPAWYCDDCGHLTVEKKTVTTCASCGSTHIHQETDVLDTWFSSALWPFSTLGWPDNTKDLQVYYPTSVLITGFDILFFWVARMMMMGLHFMKDVPFRDVYIHALVRDVHGKKMSKSKGNVIDPLVMMDKFGTDAFRFTLAAFAAQGRDILMSEDRIEGYRNFANKIWNAARFILQSCPDRTVVPVSKPGGTHLYNRWILHELNETIRSVTEALDNYLFNEAAGTLYQFFWHRFCDWYLELIKPILYRKRGEKVLEETQTTLFYVLDQSLRLLHPFMPFLTEEIWQLIPHEGTSIVKAAYPVFEDALVNKAASDDMEMVIQAITGIRNIRGEMEIPPSTLLQTIVATRDDKAEDLLNACAEDIRELARLKDISIQQDAPRPKGSASAIFPRFEIFVPILGIVDISGELARIEKRLAKLEKEQIKISKKLRNESFLAKAPRDVVKKEEGKLRELITLKEKLTHNRSLLQDIGA